MDLMSGAAGHIRHIHECLDLSFESVSSFIEHVGSGKFKAYEKFDGINIMFSYDESRGLVFARGTNDIKNGGLDIHSINEKFKDNEVVRDALDSGFRVIDQALKGLYPTQIADSFNSVGQTWYSAEIIYRPAFNLIKYSRNAVVFHESPVLRLGFDGNIRSCNLIESRVFHRHINKFCESIKDTGWDILGPQLVKIEKFPTEQFILELDSLRNQLALNYDSTIREFLYVRLVNRLRTELRALSTEQISSVAKRLAKFENFESLTEIKKSIKSKSSRDDLKKITDRETEYVNDAIAPIEELLFRFSVVALSECRSVLINDHSAAAEETSLLLNEAKKFGKDLDRLTRHFKKLEMFETNDLKIEGVVGVWEDNLIKLTGFFAPINAVLGTLKYGR